VAVSISCRLHVFSGCHPLPRVILGAVSQGSCQVTAPSLGVILSPQAKNLVVCSSRGTGPLRQDALLSEVEGPRFTTTQFEVLLIFACHPEPSGEGSRSPLPGNRLATSRHSPQVSSRPKWRDPSLGHCQARMCTSKVRGLLERLRLATPRSLDCAQEDTREETTPYRGDREVRTGLHLLENHHRCTYTTCSRVFLLHW
jgi:hypothetical protein